MNFRKLFISFLGALVISGSASAAVLVSSTGSPANVVTDYSTPSLVSFDLDLENFSSTRLNFVIEEGDLLGPLSLNALVRNLSGMGIDHFTFALQGITFAAAGSVTPAFGTLAGVGFTNNLATIDFRTPEFAEFQFGNPFALDGKTDWVLNTANLRAGDQFSITASVPEPSTTALMLAMLIAGSLALKRRDGR